LKLPAARYAKLGEPRKRSAEKRRAICVQKEDTSRIQEQQLVYCASQEHVNWNLERTIAQNAKLEEPLLRWAEKRCAICVRKANISRMKEPQLVCNASLAAFKTEKKHQAVSIAG